VLSAAGPNFFKFIVTNHRMVCYLCFMGFALRLVFNSFVLVTFILCVLYAIANPVIIVITVLVGIPLLLICYCILLYLHKKGIIPPPENPI
jgi:hypothetical protein